MALALFCKALIWRSALNGALHMGQLLAWYRRESAQELHRQRCLHGRISVSLISHIQITHSEPLSSVSSSAPAWNKRRVQKLLQINNLHTVLLLESYCKLVFTCPLIEDPSFWHCTFNPTITDTLDKILDTLTLFEYRLLFRFSQCLLLLQFEYVYSTRIK